MMVDEDGDGSEGSVWQYGSILVPTFDAWPSTAISSASWSPPPMNEITISFRNGSVESYDCDVGTWTQYKLSPSRGQYYNSHFRKPSPPKPTTVKTPKGINQNPYGRRK